MLHVFELMRLRFQLILIVKTLKEAAEILPCEAISFEKVHVAKKGNSSIHSFTK